MNILVLYHSTQTYTNTVFEHLNAFRRFSAHRYFFCHHDARESFNIDLAAFDAVVIHYCLRLPYDQVSPQAAERLAAYGGLKAVYLQDEYEHTNRAKEWIRRLGIRLVFTVVPRQGIEEIYPAAEFPGVRFVTNLTGYVPEELESGTEFTPPSQRALLVGYRGRPLPMRYGQLGEEKVRIGELVKAHCRRLGLPHDIEWTEEARIYGPDWYRFMASCRSMLGSESGSNVFDWNGDLDARLGQWRQAHPGATDQQVYQAVIAPLERPGLMNQISPRAFEAISMRTVMVLFEGAYSGVLEPWRHYLPLRKDGSNLGEVFERLQDGAFVDAMARQAHDDVIGSGRYGYPAFVRMTDGEFEAAAAAAAATGAAFPVTQDVRPAAVTTTPIRWGLSDEETYAHRVRAFIRAAWELLPRRSRKWIRPLALFVTLPLRRWIGARTAH